MYGFCVACGHDFRPYASASVTARDIDHALLRVIKILRGDVPLGEHESTGIAAAAELRALQHEIEHRIAESETRARTKGFEP